MTAKVGRAFPAEFYWNGRGLKESGQDHTKQLLLRKETRIGEKLVEKSLLIAGISSVLIIAFIFIFLFKEAVLFFKTGHWLDLIGRWVYDEWEGRRVFKVMWQ
jgi:ABC-type phosphate transport system permease subunit